ncbi:MAG TPA: SusE domain-containing protein [Sphingobacteriaceae bacterium]
MKKIFNVFILTGLLSVLLWSCKKDEVQAVLTPGAAPTLTANASALTLEQANGDKPGVTFSWQEAKFGYSAAVTYTLQLGVKGANFATASTTEVGMGNGLTKTFTVKEINMELLKIVPAAVTSEVDARIKATVGDAVEPVYSNTFTLTASTYRDIINYPSLWVAGNFQGWSPATAPKLASKNDNGQYEGYIFFNDPTPEFKLVKGPDWSAGDFGMVNTSTLSNGGDNLKLTNGSGVYRLKANTTAMTWESLKVNWGLIGDATPGGWDSDSDLTFNDATGTWTITTNLNAGEIKFRANDAWDLNFGDSNNDFVPDEGGNNIKITTAGNYTITLDLSVAGNYFYQIKKN